MTFSHRTYLLLGSNMGERRMNLIAAQNHIAQKIGHIKAFSAFYETEPWGVEGQDDYINQALEVETGLSPELLLQKLKEIEKQIGRVERGKWASRIIDIDILFFDDLVLNNGKLHIPHKMIEKRNFVIIPLNEIAPGFVHPVSKKTISELVASSKDTLRVTKDIEMKSLPVLD